MNLKTTTALGLATAALAAGAITGGTLGGADAAPAKGKIVEASAPASAHAKPGKVGWQGAFTYSLPTGSGGVFFHYPCPSGLVARSGAWSVNSPGQAAVRVVGEGPRWDQNYTEWFSTLLWAGGAPSGVQITYDVYCTRTPA